MGSIHIGIIMDGNGQFRLKTDAFGFGHKQGWKPPKVTKAANKMGVGHGFMPFNGKWTPESEIKFIMNTSRATY